MEGEVDAFNLTTAIIFIINFTILSQQIFNTTHTQII